MYNVSDAYRQQMTRPVQHFKLRGSVGTKEIDDNNILYGTLKITNQCSGTEERSIGSVYVGELTGTFIGINLSSWSKKQIKIDEGLLLPDGTYEYVPMGVYTVSEANITKQGVEVTAYDNMTKFDKSFKLSSTSGTIYELLNLCCEACGVNLATTEDDLAGFMNTTEKYTLYPDNDIETYRDLLYWIAQTCAAFATINRSGALELRTYGMGGLAYVPDTLRFDNAELSNIATYYTGLSLVNSADKTTTYYSLDGVEDTGLTYNLGANPLLQYGTSGYKEARCQEILRAINITSKPFTASILCGAPYDLGQDILLSGGLASSDKMSHLMCYTWNYGSSYDIEAYGANPNLSSAKSKTDKNITGLMSQTEENTIYYYTFMNASAISVADGSEKSICSIKFASKKSGMAVFMEEVLLDATATEAGGDIVAKVTYLLNNSEVTTFYPVETWKAGKHILNLLFTISMEEAVLNSWQVKLSVTGGRIDIPASSARATIYGQALAAGEAWDGTLNFEDALQEVPLTGAVISEFIASTSFSMYNLHSSIISQQASEVYVNSMSVDTVGASIVAYANYSVDIDAEYDTTYDTNNVKVSDGKYIISGTAPQDITAILINTDTSISTIGNITMDVINCTFQFSDGGDWKSYIDGGWAVTDAAMNANDVLALTSLQWLELVSNKMLEMKITMTDANSEVTLFHIEYTEVMT